MSDRTIRIGGASGYWGDTSIGPAQLLRRGGVDYLILDYLAEVTMSILVKARARDPEAGYAADFVSQVMAPLIREIAERRVRVVTNAGGLNPQACRRAIEALAAEAGVSLTVGTVAGDDLMPRIDELRGGGFREFDLATPMPERLLSANAYLGAFPIAAALEAGADIVVTGRCVDSALVAGPLIKEFGWGPGDLDRLAMAGLAGHLLECGAQATGGNFTDWKEMADGWADTGFPLAEVSSDGSFVVSTAEGTGGRATPLTVAEQLVYEIGDPAAYILPDVVCDFSGVELKEIAPGRVRVTGARGRPASSTYKVSATHADGFACIGAFVVAGQNAVEKAHRQGDAVIAKCARLLAERNLPPFSRHQLQVIGSEALFGAHASAEAQSTREVVLRLAVQHPDRQGAELFSREFIGAGLSMAPGLTLVSPGRPKPSPVIRLWSFLVPKDMVAISVEVAGTPVPCAPPPAGAEDAVAPQSARRSGTGAGDALPEGPSVAVPLRRLAVARSGDKGDSANIGVIARKPDYLPILREQVTPEAVGDRFAHLPHGRIERFDLPGIHAMNFLMHRALGGGGAASINLDPQAKTYAQVLLDMPVAIPAPLAERWELSD